MFDLIFFSIRAFRALWRCGIVALRHCGIAALRHCGFAALRHCGMPSGIDDIEARSHPTGAPLTTPQCHNAAMPQCRNAAMPQCCNAATPQCPECPNTKKTKIEHTNIKMFNLSKQLNKSNIFKFFSHIYIYI